MVDIIANKMLQENHQKVNQMIYREDSALISRTLDMLQTFV